MYINVKKNIIFCIASYARKFQEALPPAASCGCQNAKFVLCWSSTPDPDGGAHIAPSSRMGRETPYSSSLDAFSASLATSTYFSFLHTWFWLNLYICRH